ncbi:sn-glycerol-3-phosphate ABC transporter ATP-binding protein UgpC [Iamia majanohamensis]|uniref:Sn-glycerol-3-phosphate ABC transporter ATP-binding protein UgpC n=1 Tax=Iamia majanohamensis TaxID=467976 RepID=A0AAE9Y3B8_9ACTN|nr:sn-glycerol-3-phosphate ABC transporter ATP-binding protein UgpC [Iamia majanohamensis]WCO65202.1 sn-glycerol-3-phosphate ABC transporter ATP-binding protein UgpC [Iamia majanohamensis]
MAEIVLDAVTKSFGDGYEAVKHADFTIGDGEFFILVGPSGCGKSTLLNMIVGLEDISSGELRVDGERVNDVDPKDRNMAMVFQSYAIYPHMTVRENMEFPLKLRKTPKDEMARKVEEAAGLLELTEHLDRKPANLSGGQRQRVAMGRAIVRDPAAFLMDEPLSNLDAKLRVQMRTTISRLQQRLGTTTVYVTHDQVEAMTLGDRVAVLRRGEVQQVASPRQLYQNPANLFVAGFIGSPAMNLMPAELDGRTLRLPMVDLELPDQVMARLDDGAPSKVIAGLRPEAFEDAALVSDAEAPGATFTATVDVIEWLGSEMFAHFEVEGSGAAELQELAEDLETVNIGVGEEQAQLVARVDVMSSAKEQSEQEMWVDARAVHLFDPDSGRALLQPGD